MHACVHVHTRVCVCVCVHACTMHVCVSVRETEISCWVYECVRVGVWEAVRCMGVGVKAYGCGSEGGQDENIDYTCAEYVAY